MYDFEIRLNDGLKTIGKTWRNIGSEIEKNRIGSEYFITLYYQTISMSNDIIYMRIYTNEKFKNQYETHQKNRMQKIIIFMALMPWFILKFTVTLFI